MHRIRLVLFFIFLFLTASTYSQDWNRIFMYETDAENYMFDRQFDKAIETFKKAAKLLPDYASIKFKIGYCYLNTDDQKKEALSYLEEAAKDVNPKYDDRSLKESAAPVEALYLLGEAYRLNGQYQKAADAFKKYKGYLEPGDKLIELVDQNITSCLNVNSFIEDSISVKSTNLGKLINNDSPNINAVVSGDGNTLAFTTLTALGNEIFVSKKEKGVWAMPTKITNQLGDKYLLTCSLSFDGKDLYLSTDDPVNADILVTTFEKNKWIKPIKFKKPINTKSNETHVCVSKDGNTMYFTSDRKGGFGDLDIYKVTINEKGVWGDPVNLGPEINTPFNETTPFLSTDEKYLFFSSEGHNGMGGYDVFYVNLEGSPTVVNIGYPVNNSDDNLFYVPENSWKSGYISFYNKKNNFGKRDIYHIDISRYTNINGKILADANDVSSEFKVNIYDPNKNDTIARFNSTLASGFNYRLGSGNYQVFVNNNKYLPFSKELSITGDNKVETFEALMSPIPVEQPKLVVETPKVEVKKDTTTVKEKPIVVAEVKKIEKPKEQPKEKKKEPPKEIKKEVKVVPVIKIESSSNTSSTVQITTYAVQLMALKTDVGVDYFKNIDNIEVTTTPDGYFRYSVGSTESLDEAMATLKQVKDLGYAKAFVRIDRKEAFYTIQLMALHKPADISTFASISGVNENKGDDGIYRYQVGTFSSILDAKKSLVSIYEAGYKNAFIKKIPVK